MEGINAVMACGKFSYGFGRYLKEGYWRIAGKKLKAVVCKLAWGSAVYNIWQH
jgi:hypothetical protein